MQKKNSWLDGIMGLVVADALGVPVEFTHREELKKNPVTGMRGYGTYNLPEGSWSDDTSMTLATISSLKNGFDLKDMMDKFAEWMTTGAYTPFGEVFDIGGTCSAAITHYGVCSTAAGTVAKDVDCDGFVLSTGSRIAVMFTNGNTASLPTLNVNNTGDVAIFYENAAVNPEYLAANRIHEFIYDGTHFVKVGDFNTTNEYTLDNITGVLALANGGTGASTAEGALTNLGLTATATEINKLDGMTASTDELNILDGALVSTTELNYLDGVTSAVQTQINGKAPTSHASTATTYGVSSASNYGHAMASGTTPKDGHRFV